MFGGLESCSQRADQPDCGDERLGRAWSGAGVIGQRLGQRMFVPGGLYPKSDPVIAAIAKRNPGWFYSVVPED